MTAFTTWAKTTPAKCKQAASKARVIIMAQWQVVPPAANRVFTWLRTYKVHLLTGFTAIGLIAGGTVGWKQYVDENTHVLYHVLVNGQDAGTISDPGEVSDYISNRNKRLEEDVANVHLVVDSQGVSFVSERVFKGVPDKATTFAKLDELISPYAVGAELVIDGESVGIVKDEQTAQQILTEIEQKYVPDVKSENEVRILSAGGAPSSSKDLQPGESELESVGFAQDVKINHSVIDPSQLMDPDELLDKLVTGSVQPTKYTVVKGDCVSCIAQNFNISKQVIYENNSWIQDDMIRIGDVLDLTVLQPALTVKTVERIVENQEIQHDTDYIKDETLRAGTIIPISPGKNGLKKVVFEVTKANGQMQAEEVVDEEILEEPVTAVARKGTKVILGEGTGKFAWPVVSPSITSGYGSRWGALHKGLDLVSKNRNIMAADNGKVISAGYKSDYGNYVVVDHLNGYKTWYAHMSSIYTSVGKIVEKGEKIGYMGATGDATGVHLHFEIRRNNVIENPLKYLNR
jgi:murein DD-endopeptidase MepM/ murein hydrolase activator NlpD